MGLDFFPAYVRVTMVAHGRGRWVGCFRLVSSISESWKVRVFLFPEVLPILDVRL
jgi:hypothetical protein